MSFPMSDSGSRLRVYLIEDEEDLREALAYSLAQMGFDVQGFADAAAFYRAFAVAQADVVVIDVGLPGEDGFAVASHLRTSSNVGIIFATARGELDDRLHGMRSGADAYLVKPLHPEELAVTIEAIGRRVRRDAVPSPLAPAMAPASPRPAMPSAPLRAAGTTGAWQLMDGGWTLCSPGGESLGLTTSERAFLSCLFERRGVAVSREQIAVAMGGNVHEFDLQRIDAVASRLRRKAAEHNIHLPLRAVRGTGYAFAG